MKRVRLFSPFVRLLSLLFCFFFFVPPFFCATCSHFHVDLKKDDDEALNLRFFVPSSCLCRHISPKHPIYVFSNTCTESINRFCGRRRRRKVDFGGENTTTTFAPQKGRRDVAFFFDSSKKNILSSSESSFLDHRSKKRSKRRYQRCRLVGKN